MQQGPTADLIEPHLLCLDCDETLVITHYHNTLISMKGESYRSLFPPQIKQNGPKLYNYEDPPPPMSRQLAQYVEGLLNNPLSGLKNGEAIRDDIQMALNHGHYIAITSFTAYPSVIVKILQKMGLNETELKQIVIISGFPTTESPRNPPSGKFEHISLAMLHFKMDPHNMAHRRRVRLMDDSGHNCQKAHEWGFNNPRRPDDSYVGTVPKGLELYQRETPEYLQEIQEFINPVVPMEKRIQPKDSEKGSRSGFKP